MRHALCAGTHGDTWQNGPPLEWLAKIARPPTPAQELGGSKLPSLDAISEEAELPLSNREPSGPQIPSLFLVRMGTVRHTTSSLQSMPYKSPFAQAYTLL